MFSIAIATVLPEMPMLRGRRWFGSWCSWGDPRLALALGASLSEKAARCQPARAARLGDRSIIRMDRVAFGCFSGGLHALPLSAGCGLRHVRHSSTEELRQAMAQNPFLHVMVQSGYYDGATDYFSAKYVMWNMDPSGRLRDRLRFAGYRSGHMMYLRAEDLETSNEDIRAFIRDSRPQEGQPARYGQASI